MSPAYTTTSYQCAEIYVRSGVVRTPSDWQPEKHITRMRHLPTGAVFEIYDRPGANFDEPTTAGHFEVWLEDVIGDGGWPHGAVLRVLKHEAVLMALYHAGLAVRERKATAPECDHGVGL